ncbi:MAG: 23S rRNA (adenine1618-N6)-methyltransferase [Alteromonadaceae bacterium]|jgi:23S rRNA (adenine1618-N6)-methyltransferase
MTIKNNLHPRNIHKHGYDFTALALTSPSLSPFIVTNKYQNLTIDFSCANAVKALNVALLKQHYQIAHWDIPQGYLCPPIPGRVDYLHYLADLLKATNGNKIPNGEQITVIDIGTGASCIYPLLGHQQYQWQFVATDIDPVSIEYANKNIQANDLTNEAITCLLQEEPGAIFKGVLQVDKKYDLTMCNPPFHRSKTEATHGSQQKWQNLNKSTINNNKDEQAVNLNFGGQNAELWCAGGELAFIRKIINESRAYQQHVLWFTCLVSKKDNLRAIKQSLKKAKVTEFTVINMAQGQKISRFIAWSYLNKEQQQDWCKSRF